MLHDILKQLFKMKYRMEFRKNNVQYDDINTIGLWCKLINSKIGYHSSINEHCYINNTKIGRYTQLASWVRTCPRDHIYQNFMIGDDVYFQKENSFDIGIESFDGYGVDIGNDVWIGERTIILPHVKVGNGAIIAAGSVVTKSIPNYAIVGGAPAKFIKYRFPETVRSELEKIKWYEWDINKVLDNKEYLEDIVDFDFNYYYKEYNKIKKELNANKEIFN